MKAVSVLVQFPLTARNSATDPATALHSKIMLSKDGGRIVSWLVQPLFMLLTVERIMLLCISWYYFLLSLSSLGCWGSSELQPCSLFTSFPKPCRAHTGVPAERLPRRDSCLPLLCFQTLAEIVPGTPQVCWFGAEEGDGMCGQNNLLPTSYPLPPIAALCPI